MKLRNFSLLVYADGNQPAARVQGHADKNSGDDPGSSPSPTPGDDGGGIRGGDPQAVCQCITYGKEEADGNIIGHAALFRAEPEDKGQAERGRHQRQAEG